MRKNRWDDWLTKVGILRIDRYIIGQFLGTFLFTIALIMAIIVAIDIQEKLDIIMDPMVSRAVIIRYYIALIPYFSVLLTPLFIFLSVVFFTSKLAARSEIIAMQAAGMSFNRLLYPYMISAGIVALVSFVFSSEIIPKLNVHRVSFEDTYVSPDRKVVTDRNLQVMIGPGEVAFFSTFETDNNVGYNFSLEKYEDNKLVSRMTGQTITYDSLFHWTAHNYQIRNFEGLVEEVHSGDQLDTTLLITPSDIVVAWQGGDQMTTSELHDYVQKQKKRGVGNIQAFQVEFHRRFASIPAAFILTLIGVALSARKAKGGTGVNIAIGLVLSFSYILLFMISTSYAVSGALSPLMAAWLPNLIFLPIAFLCYLKAPR